MRGCGENCLYWTCANEMLWTLMCLHCLGGGSEGESGEEGVGGEVGRNRRGRGRNIKRRN